MKPGCKFSISAILIFTFVFSLFPQEINLIMTDSDKGDAGLILRKYIYIQNFFPGKNYYLVDTGNFLGTNGLTSFTKGKLAVDVMNRLGYFCTLLGHHEFDYGIDVLKERIKESDFSYLSSNIPVEGAESYRIITKDDIKIGIFSLGDYSDKVLSRIKQSDVMEAARAVTAELKKKKCDAIILLTDMDSTESMDLLEKNPDVDFIFTSQINDLDTYSTLDGRGVFFCHENDVLFLKITRKNKTGSLEMHVDRRIIPPGNENIKINDPAAIDAKKMITESEDRYYREKSSVLARTGDRIRLNDLLLKIMRENTYSEAAFLNSGAFSDDLVLTGDITEKDILEKLKYNNRIATITLTGAEIKKILELDKYRRSVNGKHLFYSGIENGMINGRPISNTESYTVSLNDFLLGGGDGFLGFKKGEKVFIKGFYLRDELISYLKSVKTLSLKDVRRIKPVLYWKYMVDINSRYDGNFNYNNYLYPENSLLDNSLMYHLIKTSGNFYSEWKNRWHLLSMRELVNYEFLISEIDDLNETKAAFKTANNLLSLYSDIRYEFNFQYASPYINFALDNLKFRFNDPTDDSYKLFKLVPETGIRHYLPLDFHIGESILFNIYPAKDINPAVSDDSRLEVLFKIGFFLPANFRDIIYFNDTINFYFFVYPAFDFAFENISRLKIKIFRYLYSNFDFVLYVDTKKVMPAVNLIINAGLSFFIGTIKK